MEDKFRSDLSSEDKARWDELYAQSTQAAFERVEGNFYDLLDACVEAYWRPICRW